MREKISLHWDGATCSYCTRKPRPTHFRAAYALWTFEVGAPRGESAQSLAHCSCVCLYGAGLSCANMCKSEPGSSPCNYRVKWTGLGDDRVLDTVFARRMDTLVDRAADTQYHPGCGPFVCLPWLHAFTTGADIVHSFGNGPACMLDSTSPA